MNANADLPPEFDPLLAELADQPEPFRVMWRYGLVLMIIEGKTAPSIGTMWHIDTRGDARL
jgi:hypothetical protein